MVEVLIPQTNTKKIDLVTKNFHDSQSWQQSSNYISEWRDWFNSYRSVPPTKPEKWMSNIHTGMVFSKVETAYSNLLNLFFAVNPPFQVRPREISDDMPAKAMEQLLRYQFDEADVFYEFAQFLRNCCIFGTGIGKIIWDVKFDLRTEWKPQYAPVTLMGVPLGFNKYLGDMPTEVNNKSFVGPRFINCNLSDIFPEPTSIDIQDGWVIHRTHRTKDYLVQMHENYPDTYNEEVYKITEQDSSTENKSANDIQYSLSRLNKPPVQNPEGAYLIEVKERWGLDIDPADGKLKSRVITTVNDKLLIRDTNNPYWHGKNPFVKGCYIPSVNEFYGIGIPEILDALQNGINEMVNQRNDNISLALNRIILYKRGSGIKIENLKSEPGIRIGVNEELDSSIRFVDMPLNTGQTFMHTQEMERWAQEATAVTKLTLGMTGKDQNDTATGMSILQRASGDRFMTVAKIIENMAFREILKQFYQLDYQYIDQPTAFRIIGENANYFFQIKPEEVRKDYDFIPAGIFTMENKGQTALRLIQFKSVTKDDPAVKQFMLDKKICEALQITDNPEEFMRSDGEMMEIMKLAQTMAANMVMNAMNKTDMQKGSKPSMPAGPGEATGTPFPEGSPQGGTQVPPPSPQG